MSLERKGISDVMYHSGGMSIEEVERSVARRLENCSADFVVIVGLARTGTTVMQIMMAHIPEVKYSEFQPWKYLLRHSGDSFLYGEVSPNDTIVLKETLGPGKVVECELDPVGILLKSGIPAGRISAVYIQKEPLSSYNSWLEFIPKEAVPELFLRAQENLTNCYEKYKTVIKSCVPFYYEAFKMGTIEVFSQLSEALHMSPFRDLNFNEDILFERMIWNEATDPTYWKAVIRPMLDRGGFIYGKGDMNIDLEQYAYGLLEKEAVPCFEAWKQKCNNYFAW